MKSFNELYQELQDITGDASDAQLTIFKRWINDTNRIVSTKAPFLSLETTPTKDTVASQEGYQIPNTIQSVRSIKITLSGGTIYRPRPVEDPRFWEYLHSLQFMAYLAVGTTNFFFCSLEIELYLLRPTAPHSHLKARNFPAEVK